MEKKYLRKGDYMRVVRMSEERVGFYFSSALYINFYMGLRYSELKTLRYSDINLRFTVYAKKQKKNRMIITHRLVLDHLERNRHKYSLDDYILRSNKENIPMSNQYFNRQFQTLVLEAKIPDGYGGIIMPNDIGSHTIRKSFGRAFWEANQRSNASLILLQKIFKHESVATTVVYLGIQELEIQQALANM